MMNQRVNNTVGTHSERILGSNGPLPFYFIFNSIMCGPPVWKL